MSVAVPIAPRFFVFLAALAASLTLDLLFFFGARGSSASFTFFAFDRGAGGGHEPPRSASALVVRGRAASATVKAASSRAMARAMAPQRVSAALRVALLCCAECKTAATASYGQQVKCTGSLHRVNAEIPLLGAYYSVQRPLHNLKRRAWCASVLQDASTGFFCQLLGGSQYYGLENRLGLILIRP